METFHEGEAEARGGAWGGGQGLGQALWVPPLPLGREIGEGREGRGSQKVWAGRIDPPE